MGTYIEVQGNLFERGKREKDVWFVQCVSRDLVMGAGIALQFNREFDIRNLARSRWSTLTAENKERTRCLRVHRVFNLITKEKYYNKPTLETMSEALESLRGNIRSLLKQGKEINEIRLPLIGCGLDKLKWEDVKPLLMKNVVNHFQSITFKVYYLREEDLHGNKNKKEEESK